MIFQGWDREKRIKVVFPLAFIAIFFNLFLLFFGAPFLSTLFLVGLVLGISLLVLENKKVNLFVAAYSIAVVFISVFLLLFSGIDLIRIIFNLLAYLGLALAAFSANDNIV